MPRSTVLSEKQMSGFMRHVRDDDSGCHVWAGPRHPQGHGIVSLAGGVSGTAARVIYEHHFGPMRPGSAVLRVCGNKLCVNPHHLKGGSFEDVAKIRRTFGQARLGENVRTAKLKASDIVRIRELKKKGHSFASIAKTYDVTAKTIHNVIKGRTWSHV